MQIKKPASERRAWSYTYYTNQSNDPLNHNLKKFHRPADRTGDGVGDYSMEFVYYTNDAVYAHTDGLGHTTRFEYDALGRVMALSQERRVVESGTPRVVTARIEKTYDALGRITQVRNTSTGVIVDVEYDANGLETRRMTHVPKKPGPGYEARVDRAVTYDAMDRVVAEENALHETVTMQHDVMGRPVQVTSPLGSRVTNEYDLDGKVTRTVDAVGAETLFTYDIMGRKIAATDALGRTTRVEYDPLGRVRRTYGPATSGEMLTSEVLEFDAFGRALRVKDAAGRETQTVYDEMGRTRSVTVAVGTADAATTTFVYDLMGRLTSRTDAENHTVSVRYDKLGRAIETTDALGRKQYATYDEAGNVIESVNAAGEAVRFEYDVRSLLRRVVAPNSPSVEKQFLTMNSGGLFMRRTRRRR